MWLYALSVYSPPELCRVKAVRRGPIAVAGDAVSPRSAAACYSNAIVFYGAPVPSRARIAAQISPGEVTGMP